MVFDKFHVAKHLSEAVDKKFARRNTGSCRAEGDERLKGTKYDWLKGRDKFDLGGWRVLPVAAKQLEDIACLGIEGTGYEVVGFQVCDGGEKSLQLVVPLGDSQSPEDQ